MDNYNNLRRIAMKYLKAITHAKYLKAITHAKYLKAITHAKYNFNNITHFLIINNLIDDKFIEITNNEFIKLNTNYIIDHYTNITKTKHVIFILSQDKKDYIITYYNNYNEIILHDVLLENESFLTNVINILRLNNFKKILYINDDDLLYKNILCYKSSIFYKNNFRYINELDNERSQYNIDKLNNLKIKDIKLDKIINMIDNIIDYYNDNLDKNICFDLYLYKSKHMYLDI
jgi:hypothetical protein